METREINTRGIGLGLYICRKIVRQLGGEIVCQSQWGHGSKFTFQLNLQPRELEFDSDDNLQRCINPSRERVLPRINIAEES